jgi:hypothetical protein
MISHIHDMHVQWPDRISNTPTQPDREREKKNAINPASPFAYFSAHSSDAHRPHHRVAVLLRPFQPMDAH